MRGGLNVAFPGAVLVAAGLGSIAHAGSGPWTLEPTEHNLYIGSDYYRFSNFNGAKPDNELPTGITAAGLTGVWTYGMAYNVEFEAKVAFESVRVNDPRSDLCRRPDTPRDWCDPTSNLGDLGALVKWRAIDEAYGSPISLSLALGARSGEAYANQRRRLTTLGDGQSDLGAALSLGRTAQAFNGWYNISATLFYWYRLPNGELRDGTKVPGDDLDYNAELLVAPSPAFGIGPAFYGFTRLSGIALDPDAANFRDHDYWTSLKAQQHKIGLKFAVYSKDDGPTFATTLLQTIQARNNPSDTLAVSIGVGWWIADREMRRAKEDGA